MKYKVAALIMTIAAISLGIAALRLARNEAANHRSELRRLLDSECTKTAEKCAQTCEEISEDLKQLLRNAPASLEAVSRLRQQSPFIREVFIFKPNRQLIHPSEKSDFYQNYRSLFAEKISTSAIPENADSNLLATPPKNQKETRWTRNSVPSTSQGAQIAQQWFPTNMSEGSSKKRFATRFQLLSEKQNSGWIPWINQNQFTPLLWVRQPKSNYILGVQIETITLKSRLTPLIAFPEDGYFHLELVDTYLGKISGSGFQLENQQKADSSVEISKEMLPNLRIRGYLNPTSSNRGHSLALANLLLVCSLFLILLLSGGVGFYLVHREIILAGQKTSFVANVSHELKTPLTSIRMYSEMLQQNEDSIPATKKKKYLEIVISESERLSRLIANILDFSKMEAREKKYHPQKVCLNDLLEEILEQHAQPLEKNGMATSVSLPEKPLHAMLDRDSLVQIMQNLIANAIKYANEGKALGVTLRRQNPDHAEIAIADNGPGIPPHLRRKIFRKFFRVDNKLTSKTSGSGLGLSISQKLIRDQGGELSFSPNPGGGAIFTILLPTCE